MTGKSLPGLYAIIDIITQEIVQNVITISRHEAPMVRMFTDLLAGNQGPMAQHPSDYQLVRLGFINDEHKLDYNIEEQEPNLPYKIILTGKQWLAAQTPPSGSAALSVGTGGRRPRNNTPTTR